RLTLCSALLLAAGCNRATPLPGLAIGEDGGIVRVTPEAAQNRAATVISRRLADVLGISAEVGVSPAPSEDRFYNDHRAWRWPAAVAVHVAIDSGEADDTLVNSVVHDVLDGRLDDPDLLTLTISR
ncbi:MAG: hypothetical protein ACYTF0_02880, partial [Planctomycetota bacterium]